MSVNRFRDHVLVIPEDDANRQLAKGFVLELKEHRQVQVLPEVGGWANVCTIFVSEHILGLQQNPKRRIVLLLDFDGQVEMRRDRVRRDIPDHLADRVFVLGVRSKPEALRQAGLGSLEDVGRQLARDCRDSTRTVWAHDLLQHNTGEAGRLNESMFDLFR